METFRFNVTSVTHFGNGAGSAVTMQPSRFEDRVTPNSSISISLPETQQAFEVGEYEVSFRKIEADSEPDTSGEPLTAEGKCTSPTCRLCYPPIMAETDLGGDPVEIPSPYPLEGFSGNGED